MADSGVPALPELRQRAPPDPQPPRSWQFSAGHQGTGLAAPRVEGRQPRALLPAPRHAPRPAPRHGGRRLPPRSGAELRRMRRGKSRDGSGRTEGIRRPWKENGGRVCDGAAVREALRAVRRGCAAPRASSARALPSGAPHGAAPCPPPGSSPSCWWCSRPAFSWERRRAGSEPGSGTALEESCSRERASRMLRAGEARPWEKGGGRWAHGEVENCLCFRHRFSGISTRIS